MTKRWGQYSMGKINKKIVRFTQLRLPVSRFLVPAPGSPRCVERWRVRRDEAQTNPIQGCVKYLGKMVFRQPRGVMDDLDVVMFAQGLSQNDHTVVGPAHTAGRFFMNADLHDRSLR